MKNFSFAFILFFSACATTTNYGAADDILQFAIGLRDNNSSLIESHIDKPALKSQAMTLMRDMAIKEASSKMGNSLGAQAAAIATVDLLKPVFEAIANEALKPNNLAYFARRAGMQNNLDMPSRFSATLAINNIDANRVCIRDPKTKKCLLYFGKYSNVWRLNGFDENVFSERLRQLKK
ncbi:MAG: hypothetical protein J0L55_13895 [Caulobacterales bacterium]|nr:hypothetical protein [Caulobacterales bacterium]